MLRPDGYIKVLDFGLARLAGAERADDELALGTLGYMSPEEIEQRPITAASDVYSLRVVLYELASGTNPFRGQSADATTRLILGLTPQPLPEKMKAIPTSNVLRRDTRNLFPFELFIIAPFRVQISPSGNGFSYCVARSLIWGVSYCSSACDSLRVDPRGRFGRMLAVLLTTAKRHRSGGSRP